MMDSGVDRYDFCRLFVCEAAMTAPDLRTLVANVLSAIVHAVEPSACASSVEELLTSEGCGFKG
jgi:hypothetical protein